MNSYARLLTCAAYPTLRNPVPPSRTGSQLAREHKSYLQGVHLPMGASDILREMEEDGDYSYRVRKLGTLTPTIYTKYLIQS